MYRYIITYRQTTSQKKAESTPKGANKYENNDTPVGRSMQEPIGERNVGVLLHFSSVPLYIHTPYEFARQFHVP